MLNMRLQIKLVLAFSAIAAAASLLFSLIASITIESGFKHYVASLQQERYQQIEGILVNYYQENKSWDGVQQLIGFIPGRGMGRRAMMNGGMPSSERIILTDAAGRIVADSAASDISQEPASSEIIQNGTPITVGGSRIGTLSIYMDMKPGLISLEQKFADSINWSVFWSGLTAVIVAVALGLFIARRLLTPLQRLTHATEKIAAGHYHHHVPVTSHDELGVLAAAFNTMTDKLNQNEHLRKSLVADVAHELRTPLTIVRGKLESMLAGIAPADERNIAFLHDEMVRLSYIVQDLQNLSLAEAGALHLNITPTPISPIIDKVAHAFQIEIEAKQIQLAIQMDSDLPDLRIDALRIEQVLVNLVANALRYTPEGGSIHITVEAAEGCIHISIEDSGPGIPEADLPYIFERFYRGDKNRSRAEGGSGLGLAIARGYVEVHGGTLFAENLLEGGSRFVVTLPVTF